MNAGHRTAISRRSELARDPSPHRTLAAAWPGDDSMISSSTAQLNILLIRASRRLAAIPPSRAFSRSRSLIIARVMSGSAIVPLSKLDIDLALHLFARAVTVREVLHEVCGNGAEGSLLLALLPDLGRQCRLVHRR